MTIVLVCIGIAVVLSLFSYVENENWRSFHSQIYSIINRDKEEKSYGYQKARNIQNWTLSIISIVLITLFSLGYFGQTIVNNFAGELPEDKASDLSDTTAFTLNNIETELPPSEFSYQGDGGDGQPQAQEGVENPDEKSDNKDFTDTPESIKDDYSDLSPEEKIRKEAEDYKNSLNGESKRTKIKEQSEKDKAETKNKFNKPKVNGGVGGTQGSQTSGTDGVTMVEWPKKERKAYNDDDWQIRVPGYTCGIGVNDKVVLKLRVDMSGKVLDSEVVSGSNSCCIEQARNYAKKSKFEASDKMIQYINVTYRFKSQ
jgi:outer membrane biosynthesis protein TonB